MRCNKQMLNLSFLTITSDPIGITQIGIILFSVVMTYYNI